VGWIGLEIQRTSGMACVWMTEGRPSWRGGGGTAGMESGSPSGTASAPAPVRMVGVTIRVSFVVDVGVWGPCGAQQPGKKACEGVAC
jgi:hypothetical protein